MTDDIDQTKSTPEDDAGFLAAYDPTEYERPSLTVDLVLMTITDARLKVALLRREQPPARGRLALPGAFVGVDESLDAAAERVLASHLDSSNTYLEQLYTFGAPGRDPRMRIVTVAYCALVAPERLEALQDPLLNLLTVVVPWQGESGGPVTVQSDEGLRPALAFDHAEIIGMAVKRLRGKLDYAPIGYQLLPAEFTLRRLQRVHETIRGETVNKDSFRRRMLATGDLIATGQLEDAVGHRPAELYRFARGSAV